VRGNGARSESLELLSFGIGCEFTVYCYTKFSEICFLAISLVQNSYFSGFYILQMFIFYWMMENWWCFVGFASVVIAPKETIDRIEFDTWK